MTNILAIETSCDETSAAVVQEGRKILSNVIQSQIPVHQQYGGVVPEIASRCHMDVVEKIVQQAVEEAGVEFADLDAVAVTYGPGLVGALLVGVSYAKALSYALKKPLIAVNHLEGHIYAGFLTEAKLEFPFVSLTVSGGHTNLLILRGDGKYEVLGETRDDAAGEAFDKISRSLGLGYPGGPQIEKAALKGNRTAIDFPRAYLEKGSYDFSFSGVKSSVLNYLNQNKMKGKTVDVADVAASFQEAVVDVLVQKTCQAVKHFDLHQIALAGGVAANKRLRNQLAEEAHKYGAEVIWPQTILCTDNAAMIACAAYYKYENGLFADLDLNAYPSLSLETSC